jgi:hypothetical protein
MIGFVYDVGVVVLGAFAVIGIISSLGYFSYKIEDVVKSKKDEEDEPRAEVSE